LDALPKLFDRCLIDAAPDALDQFRIQLPINDPTLSCNIADK
jgi:hypothetical protein